MKHWYCCNKYHQYCLNHANLMILQNVDKVLFNCWSYSLQQILVYHSDFICYNHVGNFKKQILMHWEQLLPRILDSMFEVRFLDYFVLTFHFSCKKENNFLKFGSKKCQAPQFWTIEKMIIKNVNLITFFIKI